MSEFGGFGDVFEDFEGGGGRAPAVSWGEAPVDYVATGILVNVEKTSQTKPNTKPGDPDHILTWDNGEPRTQREFTILTEWRNFEGIGTDSKKRLQEAERTDDGLRRIFVKGSVRDKECTAGAFLESLKAANVQTSEIARGATVSFKKTGTKANPHGGSRLPLFVAKYERPTDASLAAIKDIDVVTAPKASEKPKAQASTQTSDPWSTAPKQEDEPPF